MSVAVRRGRLPIPHTLGSLPTQCMFVDMCFLHHVLYLTVWLDPVLLMFNC